MYGKSPALAVVPCATLNVTFDFFVVVHEHVTQPVAGSLLHFLNVLHFTAVFGQHLQVSSSFQATVLYAPLHFLLQLVCSIFRDNILLRDSPTATSTKTMRSIARQNCFII
jgi:hypothetical protein